MSSTSTPHALLLAAATALVLMAMPAALPAYPLFILANMLVFAIACLGLNLLYGTAGSLSFGHATFFGIAAYAGAFLYRFSPADSFEAYFASGVTAAGLLAAAIGFFCARTSKIFFAILTLSFCMIVYSLFINGAVFRLFGGLGWALYLLGGGAMFLPRLSIFGAVYAPEDFVPVLYRMIVAAFIVSAFVLWRISASPFGLALCATRDNETRAGFIGIPVWRYRWYAFILSGLFVGVGGSFYGLLARQITPEQLDWFFSAKLILAIVLGGSRHFLGPVIGAVLFVGIDEIASHWTVGRYMAFGVLLIATVLAVPRGIAGGFLSLIDWVRAYRR